MFDTYSDITFIVIAWGNSTLAYLATASLVILILSNGVKLFFTINGNFRNVFSSVDKFYLTSVCSAYDYISVIDIDSRLANTRI
jgi:hypothetical protein